MVAAQDATEDEEAADEDLGDDVIAEEDDEAEVEDDEHTELVSAQPVVFLVCVFSYFTSLALGCVELFIENR